MSAVTQSKQGTGLARRWFPPRPPHCPQKHQAISPSDLAGSQDAIADNLTTRHRHATSLRQLAGGKPPQATTGRVSRPDRLRKTVCPRRRPAGAGVGGWAACRATLDEPRNNKRQAARQAATGKQDHLTLCLSDSFEQAVGASKHGATLRQASDSSRKGISAVKSGTEVGQAGWPARQGSIRFFGIPFPGNVTVLRILHQPGRCSENSRGLDVFFCWVRRAGEGRLVNRTEIRTDENDVPFSRGPQCHAGRSR